MSRKSRERAPKKEKPATKAGSQVTPEGSPGKRKGMSRNTKIGLVVLAAVGIPTAIVILFYGLGGGIIAPEQVAPADRVILNIYNGGNWTNETERYSVRAYTVDPDTVFNNASMKFYKEWVCGTNGSAKDVDLKIEGNVKAFVLNLAYNKSGVYGNFSNFSVYITENGKYNIKVFKDPEKFTAGVLDENFDSNITGDSKFFVQMRAYNESDSAYYVSWHPNAKNGTNDYFYINFTADADISNGGFIKLENVLKDPFTVNNDSKNVGNIVPLGLSNSNKSIIYGIQLVRNVHLYEFSLNNSIANLTSVEFCYGDSIIQTITI